MGGLAGENLTKKCFVNFLVLKLIYSGFNVLNLFTEGSTFTFKENCTFRFHFPGGGGTQLLIPYRTFDFQGESGPPALPTPPPPPLTTTSSLGPCITDPSQNDRVSCLNHELCLVCFALISYCKNNVFDRQYAYLYNCKTRNVSIWHS